MEQLKTVEEADESARGTLPIYADLIAEEITYQIELFAELKDVNSSQLADGIIAKLTSIWKNKGLADAE